MSFPVSFITRDGVGRGGSAPVGFDELVKDIRIVWNRSLTHRRKLVCYFCLHFLWGWGGGGGKSVGRGPLNNKRWPNLDWTLEALFLWDNLLALAKLHCINVYCLNTNPNCTSGLTLLGDHLSKHIILTIMLPFLLRYSDDCGVVAIIYWFSWRETVFVFFSFLLKLPVNLYKFPLS